FAETLANLVTFRRRLPQGAPTSPKISDLVARPLDRRLRRLAKEQRWFYSRYADDLCFSSRRFLSRAALNTFIEQVRSVLGANGFKVNDAKTRVMRHYRRQVVA